MEPEQKAVPKLGGVLDATTAKLLIDGLFKFAESKTNSPVLKMIESSANVAIDVIVDQYLATLPTA